MNSSICVSFFPLFLYLGNAPLSRGEKTGITKIHYCSLTVGRVGIYRNYCALSSFFTINMIIGGHVTILSSGDFLSQGPQLRLSRDSRNYVKEKEIYEHNNCTTYIIVRRIDTVQLILHGMCAR